MAVNANDHSSKAKTVNATKQLPTNQKKSDEVGWFKSLGEIGRPLTEDGYAYGLIFIR